jgi:hypothetical protein
VYLGLAYFTPDNPKARVVRHLWFILSDPTKSDHVVNANVSTKRCPSGEVCIVAAREHPAVSEDSYLRLREVRLTSVANLDRLLRNGTLQQTKDASTALCTKLQQAIGASRAAPKEAQDLLRAQGYIT